MRHFVEVEIDVDDLEFTEDEIRTLAEAAGLTVLEKAPIGCALYNNTIDRIVDVVESHIFTPFEWDRLQAAMAVARVCGQRRVAA